VATRRGRWKTLCARGAYPAHLRGPSTSPLNATVSSLPNEPPSDDTLRLFQRELNSDAWLPGTAYRRNSGLYPLVCYVNNIGATLCSGRRDIAALFVARAAEHISRVPARDEERFYYDLVSRYLAHVIHRIRSSGAPVEFDTQRIPSWMLGAGAQVVPSRGV